MARKRPTLVGQPAPIYMRPCYTQAEAARIIGVKSKTFGNWARGYPYPQRPQKYANF